MISYVPLAKKLKEKAMTLQDLEKLLDHKGGGLRQTLNTGKYIRVETLNKICNVLNCDISDVIEWKEGEQVVFKVIPMCKPDMEKFREDLSKLGSLRSLSHQLGKHSDYLFIMIKKGSMKKKTFKEVCDNLGLDYKEYLND